MAEYQDSITGLHRCVQRQFRELHHAIARDHREPVPEGWDVTKTVQLAQEFQVEARQMSLDALRDARKIDMVAELEPVITTIIENQERLLNVAHEAALARATGLPQVIPEYFPTLDRLVRIMATLTPEQYGILGPQPVTQSNTGIQPSGLPRTETQKLIIEALKKNSPIRKKELMEAIGVKSSGGLYGKKRKGGLAELRDAGIVSHLHRAGYYLTNTTSDPRRPKKKT